MLSDVNLLAAESGKGDIGDLVRSGHFDVNMCLFWGCFGLFCGCVGTILKSPMRCLMTLQVIYAGTCFSILVPRRKNERSADANRVRSRSNDRGVSSGARSSEIRD